MKIIYDGVSLPMVEVGNQIIRVQRLVGGRWETFESETWYELLFPELRAIVLQSIPPTPGQHATLQEQAEWRDAIGR